jgi:methyl-accepting chemotaxis protein
MNALRQLGLGQKLAVLYLLAAGPLAWVAATGATVKGVTLLVAIGCAIAAAVLAYLTHASQTRDAADFDRAVEALSSGRPVPADLPFAPALTAAFDRIRSQIADRGASDGAAAEAARIRVALDKVATNVMVCDVDGNITYMNEAVGDMFRRTSDEIRKQLPNFDANRILGANFDIFHRNPSHQRNMLASLRGTHTASMKLGNASLKIVATPVIDSAGARLGYVVQWLDRTQEVATEQEVNHVVAAAAEGDLTQRIPVDGKTDFFATLATGINSLLDAMATTIASIKGTAAEVSRGAEEISRGNINLSQRTEEQAASLEETASSMEEMTSTVKQNADNAAQANSLAAAARVEAERGGTVVADAVVAMQGINEASAKITDIIGVIDTIAFQTNLLALNAAVEAARAGEQGRGFAVVASEVRNLASRSSEAAKEIKRLIQDSSQRVEAGTQLVDRSGQALGKIVASVQQVSQIVSEIAAASREQSAGIEQVNKAVTSMDEVTQQNAALVEQAAAAAQALMEEARSLDVLMAKYRVGEDRTVRAPRAAAPAARPVVERRAPSRPFSKPAAKKAAAPSRAASGAAPAADWDEF